MVAMKGHKCIMAIDDEPAILKLLSRILEPEGYDVVLATNGSSALSLMEEHRPDLVILDIVMPGLDGLQVLDIIRQCYNVPIIIISGKCEVTTLCATLLLGADDYITKPFSAQLLLAHVGAKLRRSELTVNCPN